MMLHQTNHPVSAVSIKAQKGVVLIVALVILLVLTVIGISSMGTATLEERMASNYRDRNVAFQAAELALRAGEHYLEEQKFSGIAKPVNFNVTCDSSPGYCLSDGSVTPVKDYWLQTDVWSNPAKHKTQPVVGSSQDAKYIIEYMGTACTTPKPDCTAVTAGNLPAMYRITAIGYGSNSNTQVMLQSTYRLQ